jgi:hypothetical protein
VEGKILVVQEGDGMSLRQSPIISCYECSKWKCNCKEAPINPIIRSRTRYSSRVPPRRDNIIFSKSETSCSSPIMVPIFTVYATIFLFTLHVSTLMGHLQVLSITHHLLLNYNEISILNATGCKNKNKKVT